MPFDIGSLLGGGLGKIFKDVVGTFKADPLEVLKMQQLIEENKHVLALKELEIQARVEEAQSREMESAASIIRQEAQSQSWLPRNVRPLLLLLWGVVITANVVVPIIARFWRVDMVPLELDEWLYGLTMVGFTGYVSARTFEKIRRVK